MARDRALVVDDEQTVQYVLTTLLQQQGYETESAGSAEEALAKLAPGKNRDRGSVCAGNQLHG